MDRTIIYSEEFESCVNKLGGYRAIDLAIEAVIDGLRRDPFGFQKFENDEISFRYAITKAVNNTPSLYLIFTINKDRTVTLERVEALV